MIKINIEKILNRLNLTDIKVIEESAKTIFIFENKIDNQKHDFIMLYSIEDNIVVFNLIMRFPTPYKNLGLDFYEVIHKLNQTCIFGHLGLLEEEQIQYLAYKSSYIGDADNLLGNKSFENFLNMSFDMVGYFHSQLN